jgi:hypothetical protein
MWARWSHQEGDGRRVCVGRESQIPDQSHIHLVYGNWKETSSPAPLVCSVLFKPHSKPHIPTAILPWVTGLPMSKLTISVLGWHCYMSFFNALVNISQSIYLSIDLSCRLLYLHWTFQSTFAILIGNDRKLSFYTYRSNLKACIFLTLNDNLISGDIRHIKKWKM